MTADDLIEIKRLIAAAIDEEREMIANRARKAAMDGMGVRTLISILNFV